MNSLKNAREVNRDILLKKYYENSVNEYSLNNTKTYNLTGGSIRRQYEYIPQSFIQSREAEGRKLILSGTNVMTPSNYNYGGIYNHYGMVNVNKKLRGGDIWGDIGNFFRPIGSAVLDVAAPALGAFVGGPMGATVAKGAREGLRAVTGFGKARGRKSKSVGVGVYQGGAITASDTPMTAGAMSAGCNGNMACVPCSKKMRAAAKTGAAKTAGAKVTAGAVSAGKKGKESRLNIVKRIMKEKNMNLGQASKYVKENGLY